MYSGCEFCGEPTFGQFCPDCRDVRTAWLLQLTTERFNDGKEIDV